MLLKINENNVHLNLYLSTDTSAKLVHLSYRPQIAGVDLQDNSARYYNIADLHLSGFNQLDHHGNKHTGSNPSNDMKYVSHKDYRNAHGRKLEITQQYENIFLITHYQLFDGVSVIKSWNEAVNKGAEDQYIEYISSFSLVGLTEDMQGPRDKNGNIWIPHNTWCGENQWKEYTLNEAGYDAVMGFSMKRISIHKTGSWTCSEFLPMGSYYNTVLDKSITWQIETTGSWQWELSDLAQQLYIKLSGPTLQENAFQKKLKAGETFTSVAAAVAVVKGDFYKSIQEMTKYRRLIRRPNKDNELLPVIFNDYMNCLQGDPTTEVLKPLIDSAKEAGCEYFCIDCGWYDDGNWWASVGEWLPSKQRFPGGLKEVIDYIHSKDMVPGLWLEIEVMGINCPMADKVPKEWFFQRNGKPMIDHMRYQLDFRNPEVRAYATSVVERLINEYGIGYIKNDYNIDTGIGTDLNADSCGEGLFEHNKAYIAWIKELFAKYPDFIIENCSSGGMRMDYNMLATHSIQSVSDQTDYIKFTAIAANSATSCTPEQAAIWSYPLKDGDDEEAAYNMINSMLFRIHQSGYLGEIAPSRMNLVTAGIKTYKQYRDDIKTALPIWPTGLATLSDEYISSGLLLKDKLLIAVWRTCEGEQNGFDIPLTEYDCAQVQCIYPAELPTDFKWNEQEKVLSVTLRPRTARLFEVTLK